MLVARIEFGAAPEKRSARSRLKAAAASYLASLTKSGQICNSYLLAWTGGVLTAFTKIPRADSLAPQKHPKWQMTALEELTQAVGKSPEVTVIDDEAPRGIAHWKRSSFLFLSPDYFDDCSPLYSGDTGRVVPLYELTEPDELAESITFWSREYRHHYGVWLSSGELEIPAYEQVADVASRLSKLGREYCSQIETTTGIPCYYYLTRYWGRRDHNK